ncbi:MAG: DNA cytosine methyltransferase [Desulfomonilaceae bacterium]
MGQGYLIDLFAGAGGFSLGACQSGFTTRLAIDNDKDLAASYSTNFPKTNLILADISNVDPVVAARRAGIDRGGLDGILGGPPCQGFSYMGNRDPEDPRNGLVWHFFRFVKACEPKFFVMENVPGLITEPFATKLHTGIDLVASRYRVIGPIKLNAADFGAATNRLRVFVIGYRSQYIDAFAESDIEGAKMFPATVGEAIRDLPPLSSANPDSSGNFWAEYIQTFEHGSISEYAKTARQFPPIGLANDAVRRHHAEGLVSGFAPTRHTPDVLKRFASVLPGKSDKVSKCTRLAWSEPCVALRAGTGKDRGSYQSVRPIHPEKNRVISIREAARIQGFPDWFQFHPTKWHSFRMIGNSVSPYVAQAVLNVIFRRMYRDLPNQMASSRNMG